MFEKNKYMLNQISYFKAGVCNPEVCIGAIAKYDKEIMKKWEKDKNLFDNFEYAKIDDNGRVLEYVQKFEVSVCNVGKVLKGDIEDAYYMYKSLYQALAALSKMATNVNNPNCNFEKISDVEVTEVIKRLEDIAQRMKNENDRRMMQD